VEEQARQDDMQLMERELALLRSRLDHLGTKLAGLKESDKTNL